MVDTGQGEQVMTNWLNNFDERQQKQIEWSILYAKDFGHGDDGHNAKLIIAQMAKRLDAMSDLLDRISTVYYDLKASPDEMMKKLADILAEAE